MTEPSGSDGAVQPIVFDYQVIDLTQTNEKLEHLAELEDGKMALGLGPKIVIKLDDVGLSQLIGRAQAIQAGRNIAQGQDRGCAD